MRDPNHRAALADTVARVHRADPGAVQRFSPHPFNLLTFWQIWQAGEAPLQAWIEQCPAPLLGEILAMLWSAAHRTLDSALQQLGETPPAPIHGELAVQNALFHTDRVLLVDWEFFGLGDPAQEIARFLFFEGKNWAKHSRQTWLDCYDSCPADPSLPDRVELYLRLFNFQAVTFLLDGVPARGDAGPRAAIPGVGQPCFALPRLSRQRTDSRRPKFARDLGAAPAERSRWYSARRRNGTDYERSIDTAAYDCTGGRLSASQRHTNRKLPSGQEEED